MKHFAIIGAGMAGIACARTLQQAGHQVTVFEKSRGPAGRMATRRSQFGGFDHGAQYFTVRDARFATALKTASHLVHPWQTNTVQVLDELGRKIAVAPPPKESSFVPAPGMNSLVKYWSEPLAAGSMQLETQVTRIEADLRQPERWQLQTLQNGVMHVHKGFDAVLLAIPAPQASALLHCLPNQALAEQISTVEMAPCWSLMLAFPNAAETLGPRWNAARSTHHRVSWLVRESSKPARESIERWSVQASTDWSIKHLEDDQDRVAAKLLKAFTEITGIRATPTHITAHRWRFAQTTKALGQSHIWDAASRIGLCGDWCLGNRVEDAFVSGLSLALEVA